MMNLSQQSSSKNRKNSREGAVNRSIEDYHNNRVGHRKSNSLIKEIADRKNKNVRIDVGAFDISGHLPVNPRIPTVEKMSDKKINVQS